MKKFSLWAVLSLLAAFFAQAEPKIALGIGPEWNMNSRRNFAGGLSASLDCKIAPDFAAGAVFTASHNFNGFTAIEPRALLRWYFLKSGGEGFFAQAEAGAFIFFEDGETTVMPLGGLRGGYRKPLGTFYIEPYGRLGYPFAFGVGILAGVRL